MVFGGRVRRHGCIHARWWPVQTVITLLLTCLVRGEVGTTTTTTTTTTAPPSVNVALEASFNSAPYLIELLETAASENASSYFPLLDRIASGSFFSNDDDVPPDSLTEKDLYEKFTSLVVEDGHINSAEGLASFKLALALRSAAPRIEAHYQFYNNSVQHLLGKAQDAACPVWIHRDGMQYCAPDMGRAQQDVAGEMDPRELPFDRVQGDLTQPPAILYADIASPLFREYHQTLSALAREGQVSYRVRYRPPQHWSARPLFVSGYGVELALKRTDYIVIDDRDAEKREQQSEGSLETASQDIKGDALSDLKPLSSSQVARLGFSTASYVMDSENPLDTLVKVSQDFPKYSSVISGHNATVSLLKEIRINRGKMLPPGYNAMWINGVQMEPRNIDAFSLLDRLRRERKLVDSFRSLDFTGTDAVQLLTHRHLLDVQTNDEPQRYDYRDEAEGGRVIIWLNNLEKDKKYADLPTDLSALLQPSFPGQLPALRRDLHNIVVPVNLSNLQDVQLVVETLLNFIKRQIPIRIGLVPTAFSAGAIGQLKIAHYLQETYGLASLARYLDEVSGLMVVTKASLLFNADLDKSLKKKKTTSPHKSCFLAATTDRTPFGEREARSFEDVLATPELDELVSRTVTYQKRLGIERDAPLVFANGVPIIRTDGWIQEMSMQISRDIGLIQQEVFTGTIEEDTWLPGIFLTNAFSRRRSVIIPENAKDIRVVDLAQICACTADAGAGFDTVPRIKSLADDDGDALDTAHMIVVGDFDSDEGSQLLAAALEFRNAHPEIELLFLHNPGSDTVDNGVSRRLYQVLKNSVVGVDVANLLSELLPSVPDKVEKVHQDEEMAELLASHQKLAAKFGFSPGTNGLVLNGRVVGPVPSGTELGAEDFELLLSYERDKRILPVTKAVKDLELEAKVGDALQLAKLTSLVALSTISEVPEGIYDSPRAQRVDPSSRWTMKHSVISVSNSDDPSISIVAAIDPASETAQKWLPILQVLSNLAGVNMKILLNPLEEIQELPVKRFYRYVLDSEPKFTPGGSLLRPEAKFANEPVDALLTLGMDVPPSWLVAPKESIHDLDNIKLRSVKPGSDVDAIYALEHILIEGHSRDVTLKSPPRGVQLLLGTESNPHFADTIIMANLGYFQFKAQPGLWKINLKPGRSQRIFNLDSAGALGYDPQPGDENNEVALLSFQGKTIFPRLSRKEGQEQEDVLEAGSKTGSTMDYFSKGLRFAQSVLSNVGGSIKGGAGSGAVEKHADINIFSVASGHLYERMLNIMMVSVMKNTQHSVKFWFIEQFLSPSFKSFLPHLAQEYGFTYEMVTYKWPHWLRGQKEKQRQIWGYKILFLDVLFPLSLDKVIFVDADQIVRTDMYDLVQYDLGDAPYGFTPMCDSRTEMEGFRFWKQGYWKTFLRGKQYHISALYVVDLVRFRALAAGDRLRGQYQALSADPNSLSNLDQDLPNHMQHQIPIRSLDQDWLWCETWCSDESLKTARTIDLCNNPMTKEPKLDRARRQVPEWTVYDDEIARLAERVAKGKESDREDDHLDYNHEEDGEERTRPTRRIKDEL